eukprot:scaffold10735_cov124-Isochrysis_galbana.AAC.3
MTASWPKCQAYRASLSTSPPSHRPPPNGSKRRDACGSLVGAVNAGKGSATLEPLRRRASKGVVCCAPARQGPTWMPPGALHAFGFGTALFLRRHYCITA